MEAVPSLSLLGRPFEFEFLQGKMDQKGHTAEREREKEQRERGREGERAERGSTCI